VAQIHRRNVDIVSLAKAMRARLKIIGRKDNLALPERERP